MNRNKIDYDDYDMGQTRTRWQDRVGHRLGSGSLMERLPDLWQMDELAAEIGQEGQARVVFAGMTGVGKRTLFNTLRGGTLDWDDETRVDTVDGIVIEPFGSFVLADLPTQCALLWEGAEALQIALGDPALIVYLIDAKQGISQIDYRWIAALRATGRPIIITLNKIDYAEQVISVDGAADKLGMPVIPISALDGTNVESLLLPKMLEAVPKLAVILGRELTVLRSTAGWRLIRQSAMFTGLIGAQPIPGLEIPVLAITHIGLVMRLSAMYGRPMTGGIRKEAIAIVAGVMLTQYALQTAIKTIPIVGSIVGGILSAISTCLIGAIALRTYSPGRFLPTVPKMGVFHRRGAESVEVSSLSFFGVRLSRPSLPSLPSVRVWQRGETE